MCGGGACVSDMIRTEWVRKLHEKESAVGRHDGIVITSEIKKKKRGRKRIMAPSPSAINTIRLVTPRLEESPVTPCSFAIPTIINSTEVSFPMMIPGNGEYCENGGKDEHCVCLSCVYPILASEVGEEAANLGLGDAAGFFV